MIALPSDDELLRAIWDALLELCRRQPEGWTLIGAQMVALHAAEHGRVPPRRSRDADVLANSRVLHGGTQRLAAALVEGGFTLATISPFGIGHRFQRAGVLIDLLGPDGLSDERRLLTVPPAHTIGVPGGTQALRRTESVGVSLGSTNGSIPRPNLLGAILLKARAVEVDDEPEAQRHDLAFLLSLLGDPRAGRTELRPAERRWLQRRVELQDQRATAWQTLGESGEDAWRAFRLLTAQ